MNNASGGLFDSSDVYLIGQFGVERVQGQAGRKGLRLCVEARDDDNQHYDATLWESGPPLPAAGYSGRGF
jgi:hypothetical protein